ncbi:MAG: hypothetical protein P9M03_03355 [Candidatus Theseobacter exili]|nr:hypothetical protein [Candidatus Theseobacter exili]
MIHLSKKFLPNIFLIFIAMLFAGNIFADDVTDSIDEAVDHYKKGQFRKATSSLDFATQLIRQKRGESLKTILPEPLQGWTSEKASSQAMGSAMMGGMISSERMYKKGDSTITIRITTDSPMIQGMVMMMSNPAFASSTGGKAIKVKEQQAIMNFREAGNSGDVNIIANDKFMITVEGNNITEKDLTDYASAVDYEQLKSL